MLDPRTSDNRLLLTEALRPPAGYSLDYAIGTTYSLDLIAMLRVPLAIIGFEETEEDIGKDSLALLNALRRCAERASVFCQASAIVVPPHDRRLYNYLEQSVFEIEIPRGGIFHPKVWILRFIGKDSVAYRVLCMTRNLTFDPTWDVIITLDGELIDREKGIAANHPLGDFIAELKKISLRPLPKRVEERINQFSNEIRRVRFELPENFKDGPRFWPLGIEGAKSWPFPDRIDRMIVMSPFLSERLFQDFGEDISKMTLISRIEELAKLPSNFLRKFAKVQAIQPNAINEEMDSEKTDKMFGLHAKLYLIDSGWNSTIWIGSANATQSAFSRNVEFLVEMTGKKSQVGVEEFLSEEDGIGTLLADFPITELKSFDTKEEEDLQKRISIFGRLIASTRPIAKVVSITNDQFVVRLQTEKPLVGEPNTEIRCRPVTVTNSINIQYGPILAEFTLSFEALTTFFVFDVRMTKGSLSLENQFVLNIPLEGAPDDRHQRMLLQILNDPDRVLRFLQLLLADDSLDEWEGLDATPMPKSHEESTQTTLFNGLPIFESLIRTLRRNPSRLDDIAHFIEDLKAVPGGDKVIPKDFDIVWKPIWAARQGARN